MKNSVAKDHGRGRERRDASKLKQQKVIAPKPKYL